MELIHWDCSGIASPLCILMRFRSPRFVVLVLVAAGALALCSPRVSAKVPWVFKNLNNALGVADRQGYCSVWCYFDETVDAGDGIELPIRFQFNSYQRSMADSCLGAGWWFPLLESTAARDGEKTIRVNLPGGDVVRLHPSKTEQGKFHTLDNTRTGTVKEGGVFTLEGKDRWRFTYEAGLLKEAGTPGGDVLRWEYEGNRVSRITSGNSGALLEATYDSATGLIEGITFNEGKDGMRLGYAEAPLSTTVQKSGTANRLVKSLSSVKKRNFSATVTFTLVDEARSLEMVVDYVNEAGEKGVDRYRWSVENGLIQRDNFGPYVVRGGGVNAGDVFYVENVTKEGKKKSYQYDRKKNEEVYGAEDGRKFIYQYVDTPGPAYNKLRRVTDIMPDGKEIISFIGLFDQAGNIRRKTDASGRFTEIMNIDSWDPAEAIPLICKFAQGEKEDLDVVGSKGRLVGAVIRGVPYLYILAEDGKLLDRPTMMSYLRGHPEIKIPNELPPWLEAAFDNEGKKRGGQ
jgi:hypothetical protein